MESDAARDGKIRQGMSFTGAGIPLTIMGLLLFDGAFQYVLLVAGAVLCLIGAAIVLKAKQDT